IEALSYVKECTIHGALLHVLVESVEYKGKFEKELQKETKIIIPTLEDVFVSLARSYRGKLGEKE
ncbi:MAG: ABC transporter ATP-binding protein, partial [Eubacteriales bacterium]